MVDLNVAGLYLRIFSNTNYLSFYSIGMYNFVSLEELDKSFIEFVKLSYIYLDLDRFKNNNDLILQCHLYLT